MSCAMNITLDLACTIAITAETTMKNAINPRITSILRRSGSSRFAAGAIRSSV